MDIQLATTDSDIATCFAVMHELRPHIGEHGFVARVRRQQQHGYRLALLRDASVVVAVAGFRLGENLAWGNFLYVDDLVTLAAQRSRGYGARLLSWLREYAIEEGCAQLHLDSGAQRKDAHRFYAQEGMTAAGVHFAERLTPPAAHET